MPRSIEGIFCPVLRPNPVQERREHLRNSAGFWRKKRVANDGLKTSPLND